MVVDLLKHRKVLITIIFVTLKYFHICPVSLPKAARKVCWCQFSFSRLFPAVQFLAKAENELCSAGYGGIVHSYSVQHVC